MLVLALENVGVRNHVLPVQCLIEFSEHSMRIDERLKTGPFDEKALVSLPAFSVNQVRIEWAVFVGVFQIHGAGFDAALHLQKEQRLVQRYAELAVPSARLTFIRR